MAWIYWVVGILWTLDGFLYFVFPGFVKKLLMRAYREARFLATSAGPATVAALLGWAVFSAPRPALLALLVLFSLFQAGLLFLSIRTTSPRPMERLLALPNIAYRLWGLLFTFLGPYLIHIRP